MSLKVIDCESLENSRKTVYDGVILVKQQGLSVRTTTVLLAASPKILFRINCLKKNNLKKKSMVHQRFSKVVTL